ncbi:MAG: hypothetical protein J6W51_05860 [Fibrobacter sp.]|nr:hypothetical protein [Fibrobacter sp.]
MKKILILLAAATAFSCSDKQAQQQDSNDKQITVQQESSRNAFDAKAIAKIQTFYSRHIFGNEFANDSVIAKYCTKELAQKLRDEYDNEYSDGGGYAVWKFRSNAQDGEDIREIEKIEPLGNGKYIVHYNDMGNKGTHSITIVQQDGEIFFDKLD